jgi:hypothetical protein
VRTEAAVFGTRVTGFGLVAYVIAAGRREDGIRAHLGGDHIREVGVETSADVRKAGVDKATFARLLAGKDDVAPAASRDSGERGDGEEGSGARKKSTGGMHSERLPPRRARARLF